MVLQRQYVFGTAAALAFATLALAAALSKDDIKMLQDDGGWEYISISDQEAGVQAEHVCFDGKAHPGECSGNLRLSSDKTFAVQEAIRGESCDRHGTYEIADDQISFFDEFGNRDGPYTIQLDNENKTLVLSMPQVRLELELESQYKEDREHKKKPPQ
ncbi:MAG: hypothetical protein JO051_07370 [Acidobacteriaceae bacterium]|nr:hypothetical protein [Acidobacteriaceae bacterium]